MAWPNSRLTSYVGGTTPAIKAFDLNEIQDTINEVINGEVTLDSLTLDGTGGAAVTPSPAGSVKISAVVSGSSEPTTSLALGLLGKESVAVGWATVVGATGALIRGVNVLNVTRTGVGQYTVDFNPSDSGLTDAGALVTCSTGITTARHGTAGFVSGLGFIRFVVGTWDAAGAAQDTSFSIIAWAG